MSIPYLEAPDSVERGGAKRNLAGCRSLPHGAGRGIRPGSYISSTEPLRPPTLPS